MRGISDELDDKLEPNVPDEDGRLSMDPTRAGIHRQVSFFFVEEKPKQSGPRSFWRSVVNDLMGSSASALCSGVGDVQSGNAAGEDLHAYAISALSSIMDDVDEDSIAPLLVKSSAHRQVESEVLSQCVAQKKSDLPSELDFSISKVPAYNMSKVKVNRVSADILREFDPLSQTACYSGVEAVGNKGGGI